MSGIYLTEPTVFEVGPVETRVKLPNGLGEFIVPTAMLRTLHDNVGEQLAKLDASGKIPNEK